MAYGTESIAEGRRHRRPGQQWVCIAQREVRGVVGVPAAFAGPSEVVVIADDTTPPSGRRSTSSSRPSTVPTASRGSSPGPRRLAAAIAAEIDRLVAALAASGRDRVHARRRRLRRARRRPRAQAMEVSNAIAPEHLEILIDDARALLPLVRHAGAVFLGRATRRPRSGTTSPGPSHVLPTFATGALLERARRRGLLRAACTRSRSTERGHRASVAHHVAAIADRRGARRARGVLRCSRRRGDLEQAVSAGRGHGPLIAPVTRSR